MSEDIDQLEEARVPPDVRPITSHQTEAPF
jgi:hypothetical protein